MQQNNIAEEEKPPIFKNWQTLYWLVIGALFFQIALFYGITKYFG